MSDSESENESSSVPTELVGFMFGNIDKHGNLENDVLDEKSKSHLFQLSTLAGLGKFVSKWTTEVSPSESEKLTGSEDWRVVARPDAIDFSSIDEVADDEGVSKGSSQSEKSHLAEGDSSGPKKVGREESGQDIILPSIVTHSSRPSDRRVGHDGKPIKSGKHDKKKSAERKKRRKERSLQKRQQTEEDKIFEKKVKILEEKVAKADMGNIFPEFRPKKVLRFLRLFGKKKSSSLPNMWKNCRKRRKKKVKKAECTSPTSEVHNTGSMNWKAPWQLQPSTAPVQDDCMTDDEVAILRPMKAKKSNQNMMKKSSNSGKSHIPEWRYGPAALWYDMLGVPDNGEGFDYGFKLKEPESDAFNGSCSSVNDPSFPSLEHFYMISQVRWEDDIIWNADDVRLKVGKSLQMVQDSDEKCKLRVDRAAHAGWVPTSTQRTALPYGGSNTRGLLSVSPPGKIKDELSSKDGKGVSSIFPIDNYELIYGDWERDIIWDDQNMKHIPTPTTFSFDPNDENIILNLPDEPKPSGSNTPSKDSKKESSKKSKVLLGKSGKDVDKDKEESDSLMKKDLWNLSNDNFYDPKQSTASTLAIGLVSALLQHSTPAMELQPMFFPTFMSPGKLQLFHRPSFARYQHGALSKPGSHVVHCVMKHLRKKAKQREQERAASGGGEVFFMRKPEDLSALDGHLILGEYSEEYPPLLSQVGMAIKVKNYHKRKPDKDSDPTRYRYGETVYSHSSPFLGTLSPGRSLQAFECNMYRAPVYEHRSSHTDFLIIRTKHNYFIRFVPCMFTVGQICPLMEVPGPNSKKATNHIRDFLQVFIYRLFARSRDNPKKMRMEEIRKAFPNHSESSIRKRLKLCADFHRTGQDSNWWVIKKDFRLPTEEEMRAMVSPEQSCAFFSMAAAEQRLKDAGYGEKTMLYQPEDDNEEEHQMKVDEEVLNAPWNTTRAFLSAIKGKCLLQVTGTADPTGCGEGFSYVKVPMKPQQSKTESAPVPPKKLVTGTDADLRRLSLSNAKQLLKKFGVPEEEIKKLSRWEVIDVVRTMSTEQARAGEAGMSKFARGTRYSVAEHQEKYKEECQRLFELQNKVLSSREILSTDEDSSSADDSDFEEMGKNIENLLSNKKSSMQMSLEKEEEERKELLKMMSGGDATNNGMAGKVKNKEDDSGVLSNLSSLAGKCLKIHRKFRNDDGSEYTRIETVRKPEVIEAYVKIRSSKNEDSIRNFMMMDEQHREEMRREKRRIQEQLRRIKRNQEKDRINQDRDRKREKERKNKDNKVESLKSSQMKCGACGELGHMRTNRYCPMYNRSIPDRPVALTEEQEEDMEKKLIQDSQHLVKVEGTKITLSKDLIKNVEEVKRKSLVLKFQKPDISTAPAGPTYQATPTMSTVKKKRRYQSSASHCDYLTRIAKKKERRRADPVVTLSSSLENVLNGIRDLPETQPFYCPVNPRLVKDYYKIVEKPMDLQTVRENLRKQSYLSRADFREHIELIVANSRLYNGVDSNLTKTAISMLEYTDEQFKKLEDKLMRLEKAINPLLDDDDQVAFSFILDNIITQKMMVVPDSWPFHNPVNRKFVPDYYNIIERPIDLSGIRKNVQKHLYQNRGQFMEHVELVLSNSIKFNGADSPFTQTAYKMVAVCRETLEENDEHLTQLENDIAAAKKAAEVEAADLVDAGPATPGTLDHDLVVDEDSNMSLNISDKMGGGDSDVDVETLQDSGGRDAEKSRLLEDLLLSDGEMSGDDDSDDDNPFATHSDSDGSDFMREDSSQADQYTDKDAGGFTSVTSFLDEALSNVNSGRKSSGHRSFRKENSDRSLMDDGSD